MNYTTRRKDKLKRITKRSKWNRRIMVKINAILQRIKMLLAILMLFALFSLIFIKPEESTVNAQLESNTDTTASNFTIENSVEVEVKQVEKQMEMTDEYYLMLFNNYPWEVCNLTFYSYRHKKDVTAPQIFRETLYKYHDCNDQLLLTKIAHYESDFNANSVNLNNTYAKGLYHVLPGTRNECANKYGMIEESDCALFVIKNFPSWYLEGYKTFNYQLSF